MLRGPAYTNNKQRKTKLKVKLVKTTLKRTKTLENYIFT